MSVKLLIYTFDWLPLVGGIQTMTAALAAGLTSAPEDRGQETISVTLVTATAANGMDDSKFPFRVVRQPSLRQLIREIRSSDIVHVAGPSLRPLLITRILRKPTVVEHHGYQAICPNGLLLFGRERTMCPGHFMASRYWKCVQCNAGEFGWFGSVRAMMLTFARRALTKGVRVNIAPSQHICNRLSLPRTQVIYHGVAPAESMDVPAETVTSPTHFAFVGRLVHEKGADVLLRAAGLVARWGYDFRIKIIGDEPERARLERMADELEIRGKVEFVGWVAPEGVNGMLSQATAVVMPSVCEDVAPLVAIEQMMQGRLIIASDIGGLGEIVDGYGLKFPAADANGLALCMRRVISDGALVSETGDRARENASKHYTEQRMIREHVDIYAREICGEFPRD